MLSNRELDILQLLAQDLSDREIADRLFIAPNTVKWYNRQIFSKLGVNSRQQAVEQARDLGLLKQSNPFSTIVSKLTVQITPFVGRVSELDDLTRLLTHPDTRFITILAPGGMGKSRLVAAASEFVSSKFADGVYFVACAAVESDSQLILTIGTTIGLQFFSDNRTPNQQLFDFLSTKSALLILDNFEHLLGAAPLVTEILVAAPLVKVLITSREQLNVEGETVFSLGGMDFPESDEIEETRLDYGAVLLFIACARRANFNFNTQDELSIVRICRLVEGMPLALELAAAWSTTFSPSEIADEIEKDADFLHTTMRNVPERSQSVRSVFETTWRRLTDDERRGFCSLSIFRGGFTRMAAQAVASIDSKMLYNFVSKALLWRRSGTNRYEIHELLRQYGEERLKESTENYRGIAEKYCRWYAEYCEQAGELLRGPQLPHGLKTIENEFTNILSGCQWAASQSRYDLLWKYVFATYYFGWLRNRLRDIEQIYNHVINILQENNEELQQELLLGTLLCLQIWICYSCRISSTAESFLQANSSLLNAIQRSAAHPTTIIALSWMGWLLITKGNSTDGIRLCEESVALGKKHNYQFELGLVYVIYGFGFVNRDEVSLAEPIIKQAAKIAQKLQQPHLLGAVSYFSAITHSKNTNYKEAKPQFVNAIKFFRELGDWWNLLDMYPRYIEILLHEENYDEAFIALQEYIDLIDDSSNADVIPDILLLYVRLLAATGNKDRAFDVGSSYQELFRSNAQWQRIDEKLTELLAQLAAELPVARTTNAPGRREKASLDAILKEIRR